MTLSALLEVRQNIRQEILRKTIHLLAVAFPVAYAFGTPRTVLAISLGAMLVLALSVETARGYSCRVNAMFLQLAGPLLRFHERRGLTGASWLLISFLGAVLLLPAPAAIVAMWAVAAGDAMAALAGLALGRSSSRAGKQKTIAGSIACWIVVWPGAFFLGNLGGLLSTVAASVAALSEWPRRPMDDNVRVTAAVGVIIVLWRKVFP